MTYRVYDINKSLIDECFKSTDISDIPLYISNNNRITKHTVGKIIIIYLR